MFPADGEIGGAVSVPSFTGAAGKVERGMSSLAYARAQAATPERGDPRAVSYDEARAARFSC